MNEIDFSIIRTVRVPHQQFVAIKNKAQCVIIEDKNKGDALTFSRVDDNKDAEEFNYSEFQEKCKGCRNWIFCEMMAMDSCRPERWQYDD